MLEGLAILATFYESVDDFLLLRCWFVSMPGKGEVNDLREGLITL